MQNSLRGCGRKLLRDAVRLAEDSGELICTACTCAYRSVKDAVKRIKNSVKTGGEPP